MEIDEIIYTFKGAMRPLYRFSITILAGRLVWTCCLIFLFTAMHAKLCTAQSAEELQLLHMFYKEKELFASATHHPKPVSQIAENVTIVTGKEIEAMNAHSVAEVLNRVPGLFINFNQGTGSIGSTSLLRVQGSEQRHVLVMVDGVPWNFLSSGSAETNTIPVGIIERIEIIKGPASSAWGSALGGLIHIITQSAGQTSPPTGSVQASRGEMDTWDTRAQVSGRTNKLGYYLFGGHQESDGPGGSRDYQNDSVYSKIAYNATDRLDLGLSLGFSQPRLGLGDYTSIDIRSTGDNRNLWGTVRLDAALTRGLSLNLNGYRFEQKSAITHDTLGLGFTGPAGALYQKSEYDETTTGANARLVWDAGRHTAVLGAEFRHGTLDQTIESGDVLQGAGAPALLQTAPSVDNGAVYLNDTLVIDRFSVTPGIRYDYSSVTDDFISPSLGLAYRLGEETIVRGSVARGFTAPPLAWTSGGGLFLDPNPSLSNEKAWSYQAGLESAALKYLWIKTTLFRHDIEDGFTRQLFAGGPPGFNDLIVNSESSRRQGVEVEVETLPLWRLTLRSGFGYVDLDPATEDGASNIYKNTVGIVFDHPKILRAELFGANTWWDAEDIPGAEYGDFIWDLNIRKRIALTGRTAAVLFFTAHNLFNTSQYMVPDNPNPDRWVEAGMKFAF